MCKRKNNERMKFFEEGARGRNLSFKKVSLSQKNKHHEKQNHGRLRHDGSPERGDHAVGRHPGTGYVFKPASVIFPPAAEREISI